MRGIAWMTMAFLPATFVTSFFGMNFFTAVPGAPIFDETSRNVWVFFAIALSISAVILTGFWFWDRKTRVIAHQMRQGRVRTMKTQQARMF
jgi:Mg2+ and Co2+ transporter CorA